MRRAGTLCATARLLIVRDIVGRRRNLEDRAIKVAIVVVVDEYPIRRTSPHFLAVLYVKANATVSRHSIDLIEEGVCWYEDAAHAWETDFDVQIVVHHVHALA